AKRRLQFQEAVKRREEAIAKREAGDNSSEEPESEVVSLEDEKIDIRVLGDQVGQLIRMGFGIALILGIYWIWAKVLPSFNALGEASLSVDGAVAAAGIPEGSLSISEVVTGLLLGVLSLLTARHVPALLELTILQRLPISRAVRYASTTLAQYLVVILGVVVTFRALGLEWSNIQWLVAALSVGLGFGLQEIVANFVSGIILLFEQPIRVGDVVTVEGTTGTVSRIRIRATTIVNFERQELVIPNKTFITGQLINWTLSDTVNRAIITVGVAYGTDTKKAMELLDEIAQDHPLVLSDPAPRVTFELFGDNTLNLLVRVYMNDIDHRLTVITDLHQRINECFEKEGITIAFPQRDVHLDTSRPLELVLRKDAN
ncbi:MAG: mechanosensitive ion channel domain-containing protein, partial [Gammaproteobacteria bacterium]